MNSHPPPHRALIALVALAAVAFAPASQAQSKKISDLPAAAALSGPELLAGVQAAANVKITPTQIKTFTSASPTLVTPDIGVATGTSLALTGALSGKIAVPVNAQSSTTYTVVASDQGKLVTLSNASAVAVTLPQATGSFTTGWSTAVENNGAGAVTVTPTTSTIDGAASLVIPQYQGVQIVSDGTNYYTLRGLTPSGAIAPTSITIAPASNTSALTVSGWTTSGASPVNQVNVSGTFNHSSGTGNVIFGNITTTAGCSTPTDCNVLHFQQGGSDRFVVDAAGEMYISASVNFGTPVGGRSWIFNGSVINVGSGVVLGWGSGSTVNTTYDLALTRRGAANLQLGDTDAASPVAQLVTAQGSRSGTDTNTGGANLTVQAGRGTGTGAISSLILQSPVAVASGTGAQTQTTGLTIKGGTAVLVGYTVSTLPASPSTGAVAYVTNATVCTFQGALTGGGAVFCPVIYNGTAWVGG